MDVWGQTPDGRVKITDWKGLALDTELPTPTGWTTIGEVCVGDQVIARDGKPCTVIAKPPVRNRDCYEITFDDNTVVVADDEHLWMTQKGVISTRSIFEYNEARRTYTNGKKDRPIVMPVAQPILPTLEDIPLPIDPYVLGIWLADGKRSSGEVCKPDQYVWDKIVTNGFALGTDAAAVRAKRTMVRTVKGLRTLLRKEGILYNKHIPDVYKRASIRQRLELLRGIMDGDGNANTARGQAVFTTTNKQLSDSVYELVVSLGSRANQATTTQRGFGKTVTAYPVSWRPRTDCNPFSLPRKADRMATVAESTASKRRYVKAIRKVDSVPTQCIAVDSADNTYLCTRSMIVTHNTGKKYSIKHTQQGRLYAAVAAQVCGIEECVVEFVYLDGGKSLVLDLDKHHVDAAVRYWREEGDNLLSLGMDAFAPPEDLQGLAPWYKEFLSNKNNYDPDHFSAPWYAK
jgi:hypothetical protein